MVEISRDGKRVYFTNSLYGAIDPQFYPEGIEGWMVKLDVGAGRRHRLRREVLRRLAEGPPAAPGAPRRRRLLVGLLLLSVTPVGLARGLWPWLALAGLGAFHGLNPAMGWLFAVALGLHRDSRRVGAAALLPIAARPCGLGRRRRRGRAGSGGDRSAVRVARAGWC